jgi:CRISPR-associated Cas5-like protein
MESTTVKLEIESDFGCFTDPLSGASFRCYPFPTFSALQQIAYAIAHTHNAYARPVLLRICSPVRYANYTFTYAGPYRKQGASGFVGHSNVLVNPRYQVIYEVVSRNEGGGSPKAVGLLRQLLEHNIREGRCKRTPFMGRGEFVMTYVGPWRVGDPTDVNLIVPRMLRSVFKEQFNGDFNPLFADVICEHGVVQYA